MINVSNDYKETLIKPRTLDAKVIVGNNTLTSSQINQIRRTFNTTLFKSVLKQVELDSNEPIQKGDIINPQIGLLIDDSFEYLSLGSYKAINEPILNKDTKSYQILTYDKIVECMVSYALTQSDITFPCSVRDLFVAIFTKLGWSTSGIPSEFVNSSSQIEEDVYSNMNMTYRDVLDELCTISCLFLIDNGNPTLMQKATTNEVINERFMKSTNVAVKERVFFNSLVFSRAEESDNIYRKDDESILESGLHEFKVKDLQILSLNWRDNFIDEMWNYIKTFEYYAYEIDTIGITYLEPIDEYTLSIFNDTYNTLLLNSDLIIGNGLSERIFADKPTESETEYKYADTTDRKINQTYLVVDKQNQKITAMASQIENDEQRIANLNVTTNDIQANVTNTTNNITNQLTALATSTSLQINALNEQLIDGVTKVKTTTGYTFDSEGLGISKGEDFKNLITDRNQQISSGGKEILFMGYDDDLKKTVARISELETIRLTNAYHRTEKITEDGEKWSADYYIGGDN